MLSRFLEDVIDKKLGIISPEKVSEIMHISLTDLSHVAAVSRNTMRDNPASEKVQASLGVIARIITQATDMLGGDRDRAIIWFRHQPLSGFEYKTAEDLVEEGHADAVLKHLDMLADGGYA